MQQAALFWYYKTLGRKKSAKMIDISQKKPLRYDALARFDDSTWRDKTEKRREIKIP